MTTKTTQPTTTTPSDLAPAAPTEIAPKPKIDPADRFAERVFRAGCSDPELRLSAFQRSLLHGYYIGIDTALKSFETRRIKKNENKPPITWANVNMETLCLDAHHYSQLGLDMRQKNHLSAVPYLNSYTGKYDIAFTEGYVGIAYIAMKYALDPPKAVTVELVHSTDTFHIIKKSAASKRMESYEFEVTNPFKRGDIAGGFGYIEYDDPSKNKLIEMSREDMMKRKAKAQSATFWGQNENDSNGWFKEMCYKTLVRKVYNESNIPRDPAKMDETYHYLLAREAEYAAMEAQAEIDANANATLIDGEGHVVETPKQLPEAPQVDPGTGEIREDELPDEPVEGQQSFGPNF